ncbi:MAG: hypothetical protein ABH824_04450 [Nanoarchaeota archaeon]|nr:hypothetical protein [Nanoarchaeota archaeon]MBU1632630.1 hypothetical protein [Nanoarchaeota archaeon]MBU1876547.1 hypothetical protein [Nanoarchaeota archaeon]
MVFKEISAILSSQSYGYKVNVLINGTDIGVTGEKSESKRLFDQDNHFSKKADSAMKRLFCLKKDNNKVSVKFSKISGSEHDQLQLSLEMREYPAPLFLVHSSSKSSGKIEFSFDLQEKCPSDFIPIFISDQEGKAVLVYVKNISGTITPSLNGVKGMAIADMPGSVVLENVKSGVNELSINYSGEVGNEANLVVVTPKEFKSLNLKITKESAEQVEKIKFVVK